LLDFGAVISVSLFERHRETEATLALPKGSLTWLGPIDPKSDPLWRSLQREEISERDYWAHRALEVGSLVGEPAWGAKDLLRRVSGSEPIGVVRPEMRALIRAARRRGIPTGVLSNELELFYGAEFVARIDVLAEMTTIVDGSHTGILKPDPRAYEAACVGLGLVPGEVLFVDDQMRNVLGGHRAGLQTHHFDLRDVAGNVAAIRARLRIAEE
jgi:putative hydrolase of the HAD superfamily